MKYFILVATLLLSSIGWSQSMKFVFRGKVENIDLGKKEGGVTVSVVQNGNTVTTTQTASSGKYALRPELNYKAPFEIIFSKAGLVSKKVQFDLSKMNEEDTPASAEFEPLESLDIDLFKERDGVDFSFLDTDPVAKFGWNERIMGAKPDMTVVNRMRNKIDDLLNQGEKNEAKYQAAIQAGQQHYDKKEYESALAQYETAVAIKPNERLPAEKIIELDALIKAEQDLALGQQQAETEYNNLISAADNFRDDGQLEKAVAKYKEAITKKPEQYPKDQVAALAVRIEAGKKEKENQEAYEKKIKSADSFFKQNSLRAARDNYEAASALKPSEAYPKNKLKEISDKMSALEEQEATKKKYDDAIAAADALYTGEDFKGAKEKYQEALTFETSATYPKERIKMCDTATASADAEAATQAKIADLIKKGNDDLGADKLPAAKASFNEVLTLDPSNQQAIDKLALIEQKVQEAGNLAAQEKKYADLIKEGDTANTAKKLEDALAKYQEAQGVKSTPEVIGKIAAVQTEIDKAKALANKAEEYDRLINDAAAKMAADDLAGAKADYTAASSVDPTQALPGKKIAEIDKLMLAQADEEAKAAEYDNLIADAQGLFNAGDLEKAKAKYVAAGKVDPAQQEPKTRIVEIDGLIAENAASADRASKFKSAVDEADHFFNEAKWEEAAAKYREAMTFDSSDPYPGRRVTEIDQKIKERDEAIAQQSQIETLLKDGNKLLGQKKLEDARGKFQEVVDIDPTNTEASTQIQTINTQLAALKSESEKEEAFNLLKEEGFNLADAGQYSEAKQKLQEALALKTDQTVKAKIDEIDKQMGNAQAQAELEKKYNDFITKAQSSEASGDLSGAITSYQGASSLKPNESMPKDKIVELQGQLSSNEAQVQLDKSYNKYISQAESNVTSGDLKAAIASYQQASDVKPNESLPKDKMQELRDQLAASLNQAETDRQYVDAMKRGDQLMASEDYLGAIGAFNDALALKPTEKEPVTKAAKAEELERERGGVEAQYEKILTVAQKKIDEGDLVKAEELVGRAKKLKPTDTRPDGLLNQIEQLRLGQADYNSNMAKGEAKATATDYKDAIEFFELAKKAQPSESLPDERIAAMNKLIVDQASSAQKDELYRDYMRKGNATETGKRYVEALSHYQDALSAKPKDPDAEAKVKEMQQLIDLASNAQTAEIEKKNKFDALIKEADLMFAAEEYVPNAKTKYEEAMALYPANTYAETQRDESIRLGKLKGLEAGQKQYVKLLKVADEKFTDENYDKAKELYERAVSIKNSDPYPKKKLAEIDAILNPVVVASVELEDLGEEFDGSIIDGGFLLTQDEEKRKTLKKSKIRNATNKIYGDNVTMTQLKTAERLETRNEIVHMLSLISSETVDSDDNRIALIEALRIADEERNVIDNENQHFERAENEATQGTLDQITREVAIGYLVDDAIHMDNAAKMDLYQTYQSDDLDTRSAIYTGHSYDTDKRLGEYLTLANGETQDDYADRLEIERKVTAAEDYATNNSVSLGVDRYGVLQEQKTQVDNVHKAYKTKAEEDEKVSGSNNDELIDVQRATAKYSGEHAELNEEHAFKTDGEIAEVRRKVISDNTGFDKIRKEATERFKDIELDAIETNRNAFNGETEKYLANQAVLNAEAEKRKGVGIKAEAAMEDKIAYTERMEKRARLTASQAELSDEKERLNMRTTIETIELSVQEKSESRADQRKANTAQIADLDRTRAKKSELEAEEQKRKALETQEKLDKVNDDPEKKIKVANALGNEYPEGVSEESFKKSDDDGLVKSIITRRVVVINGHADVYIRTQSLNGITYSKNGSPSLSHVWSKETQDPNLERHF